jgi:hypothetical protein
MLHQGLLLWLLLFASPLPAHPSCRMFPPAGENLSPAAQSADPKTCWQAVCTVLGQQKEAVCLHGMLADLLLP